MGFCTAVVHSHCCVVSHCMNKLHFVPPTGGGHLGGFSLSWHCYEHSYTGPVHPVGYIPRNRIVDHEDLY